jgi:hypothetical protein
MILKVNYRFPKTLLVDVDVFQMESSDLSW